MKNLLLVLSLVLSTDSWAAQKCTAFLKVQTETSPIARVTFSTKGNKDLSIALSREKTILNAEFTKKFLTGLNSFFAGKSTTTSRLEERAVMKESDSAKLLEKFGLKWQARDLKRDGEDFTTITTYSGKFIMDSGSDVEVSAKMRARKYFSHDKGVADPSQMESVFGDVGSLEIKISNVAGVDPSGFASFPNSVFKPRIFISDGTLKLVSRMSHNKLSRPEEKKALVDELHSLEIQGRPMNPNRLQVEEFINSLVLLLEKNPNLFEVQTVVAYNRDSYSVKVDEGTEYQYTLDRNIRIYEPDDSLNAANLSSYLKRKPLHQVEDGVAFAELKSPMIEKTENTETYQKLSHALFSKHRAKFSKGKGKHSLGSQVRATMAQTTLSEQLHTEGLLYYLIKGVGNLPTPPNRKRLVEMGEMSIALPVKVAGEDHRLILGYRPNIVDGKRAEVLSSMALIDALGEKVSMNSNGVKGIISKALETSEPSTLTIDNQALTFPSIVDPDTVIRFNDFFDRFYTNHSKGQKNSREIETLHAVDNSAHLAAYTRKMKLTNTLGFLKDRASKVAATALLIGAVTMGPQIVENVDFSAGKEMVTSLFGNSDLDDLTLSVLTPEEDVRLSGRLVDNGKFQVSAAEPQHTASPDLTIDLGAIKNIQINSEDSLNMGFVIYEN